MASRPFRFMHASDLHLERVLGGVQDVPDHLREVFRDAAYLAAARVFDAALAEEADFLVLAGDVLDPARTGLRGPLFLIEQFQRLLKRGIAVYWAGSLLDGPETWPAGLPLPANVSVFPIGRPTKIVHQREGTPLVQLVGASRSEQHTSRLSDLADRHAELFTIAVHHGPADSRELDRHLIDYWALGGGHERVTLLDGPRVAHDPGTPQGRSPAETGPHGCSLVQVDSQGQARIHFAATDAVRFCHERLALEPATTAEQLESTARARIADLSAGAAGVHLLIHWAIGGQGPLRTALARGSLAGELIDRLRAEFGGRQPALWSLGCDLEPWIAQSRQRKDEQTILGDFLRLLENRQTASLRETHDWLRELGMDSLRGERRPGAPWPNLQCEDPKQMAHVLRDVETLGLALLGGEES